MSRCHYCGFYSTLYDDALADDYLEALEQEFAAKNDLIGSRTIGTIYVGGGTPSVLSQDQLRRLFRGISSRISPSTIQEISCEVNPRSGSQSVLNLLVQSGVTRISIGVQSFSDRVLRTLQRTHGPDQAINTVSRAIRSGFRSVGLDLIYGVPDQTMEEWSATIEQACTLRPDHLSLYALSVDHGSRLADDVRTGSCLLPDDETAASMYEHACGMLHQAGYRQYEISNFALPGRECLHNQHYWLRGEYIGLGPSAWSFIGRERTSNVHDVREYIDRIRMNRSVVSFHEAVTDHQAAVETLMLGLRRTSGIDLTLLASLFGSQVRDSILARAEEMREENVLEISDEALRLTTRGMLVSNAVIPRLIP